MLWIDRDGDMRSGRVRMRDVGVETRVEIGRRFREPLGTSIRKKGKRGSIRLNIHDGGDSSECGCMTIEGEEDPGGGRMLTVRLWRVCYGTLPILFGSREQKAEISASPHDDPKVYGMYATGDSMCFTVIYRIPDIRNTANLVS